LNLKKVKMEVMFGGFEDWGWLLVVLGCQGGGTRVSRGSDAAKASRKTSRKMVVANGGWPWVRKRKEREVCVFVVFF